MGFNIPCKHQLALSDPAVIPELPKINLIFNDQWNELVVECKPAKEKKNVKTKYDDDQSYLINTIKFYSKFRENDIDSFVENKYKEVSKNETEFIRNKPAVFIEIIDQGIEFGRTLKNAKKEKKKLLNQ